MYIPKINKNENLDEIKAFVHANSFGILVSQAERLWATHIPLELTQGRNGQDVLQGHISIANPQWSYFDEGTQVLAIFNGPHSYISSSWYDHENVPTWNYIAVHIYGKIRIIKEEEELVESLKKLVDKYEASSVNPVSVEKMSEDFLKREIRGIVGFEIEIEEIQAKYKLSQNRDAKNQENIIQALGKTGDSGSLAIASEMEKIKKT